MTCVGSAGGTYTAGPVVGNISDLVNLPSGAHVTYTVQATIAEGFSGTFSNTATVTAPGEVTDPDLGDNQATDQTEVSVPIAAVTATKTVSGSFTEGGNVEYTVVLTNGGTGAQVDAVGDEFTDVLPGSLTLVSASATSGTATTAANTVSWNGGLPAGGGTVTVTIQATVNPSTGRSTIANQGTVFFDGNGSNESTAPTDDPGVAGSADPTSFEVLAPTAGVPALGSRGLLALP